MSPNACPNQRFRRVLDGRGPPISDQKYDPFLEAIELRNSDFGGAGTGWLVGWAGAGLVQDFSPLVLYCCENIEIAI